MSVTAALFLLLYFAGLLLAVVRHPRFGLYTYLFAFYMHPIDRWWGSQVPELRWSFIAAFVTITATLLNPQVRLSNVNWLSSPPGRFFLFYFFWMLLQYAWTVTGPYHTEGTVLFAKYAVLSFVIQALVNNAREIRNFLMCHLLGCFYLGWLAFGKNISGRFEGVGGPGIDDANTFSMYMATAATIAATFILRGPLWLRALTIATVPFVLNGYILTQSRGGFVGLAAAALAIVYFKPQLKKGFFLPIGRPGSHALSCTVPSGVFGTAQHNHGGCR